MYCPVCMNPWTTSIPGTCIHCGYYGNPISEKEIIPKAEKGKYWIDIPSTWIWIPKVCAALYGMLSWTWVRQAFASIWSICFMWSFHALTALFPQEAYLLAAKISNAYFVPTREWAGFVSGYVEQMTGAKLELGDIIKGGAGMGQVQAMRAFTSVVFKRLLNLILPAPPLSPEKGIEAAENFLSINMQFQMSAWFLHLMGDIMSFGMFKSLKDLPNAISWSFGLGWLSWLVLGVPFRKGIADPMEIFWNRVYTPSYLNPSELAEATQKGILSYTEYRNSMISLGYKDQLADIIYQLKSKDLSDSNLRRMYEYGILSKDELKRELKLRGYNEAKAAVIVDLISKERFFETLQDIAKESIKSYELGAIDSKTLRNYLTASRYTAEEQDLQIIVSDLRKVNRCQLADGELSRLVKNGYITLEEALTKLRNRGWDEREALLYLSLSLERKLV